MTIIWMTVGGFAAGAVIAIIIYILGFGVELINCTCQILTCNCNGNDVFPKMWSMNTFGNFLMFCGFCGMIIGLIYGIYTVKVEADEEKKRKAIEKSERDRNQRIHWAEEAKKKALGIKDICDSNKSADKPLVSITYKANLQMRNIMNELTKVAELQGKVDSLADELTKKGGTAK